MERLRYPDGAYPPGCFMCAARTYIGGEYYCDKTKLDDKNIIISVARFMPTGCPDNKDYQPQAISPELLLRKILGK